MSDAFEMRGERCRLRPYRPTDAQRLADVAGAFEVARWMTAAFPHPYDVAAACGWIEKVTAPGPAEHFVIEVAGELAGGIGIEPAGGESRGGAEFGYWLGRDYWSRGIASEAARLVVAHAFQERGLRRLQAHVFAPNRASARVLEKTGFRREAVLREAYVERDGNVVDGILYARLRTDDVAAGGATSD